MIGMYGLVLYHLLISSNTCRGKKSLYHACVFDASLPNHEEVNTCKKHIIIQSAGIEVDSLQYSEGKTHAKGEERFNLHVLQA